MEIEEMTTSREPTENLWLKYKTTQQESIQANIPHKIPGKSDSYPWITFEIKKLIQKRDRVYRQMKKQRTETLKQEVKNLKRVVQKKLRRAQPA